jgi:hypothetical protein
MGFILGGDPQPAGHWLAGWLLADFRQNQAAGKVSHFQEPGAQIARTCRSYFKQQTSLTGSLRVVLELKS